MSVARSSGFTASACSRYCARRASSSTAAPRASSSASVKSAPSCRAEAKRGHAPASGGDLGCLRRITHEDRDSTRVAKDEARLLGGQVGIERNVGERRSEAGVVRDGPLRPVFRENGDAIGGLDAELLETEGEPSHALPERAAGDRLIDA